MLCLPCFCRSGVLGIDAEWRTALHTQGTGKLVAVLTLANELESHAFQLSSMPCFPAPLRALLRDDKICFVGHNAKSDATRLLTQWGEHVNIATDTMEEATVLLGRKNPNEASSKWGLDELVSLLLYKKLPKDDHVRLSDWEQEPLSSEQVHYACLDPRAALLVYRALQDLRHDKAAASASPKVCGSAMPNAAAQAVAQELNNEADGVGIQDELYERIIEDEEHENELFEAGDVDCAAGLFDEPVACPDGDGEPDSKVKNDAFHILQRYGRSLATRSDPLVGIFICLMMSAIFEVNGDDKQDVKRSLNNLGKLSPAEIDSLPARFFNQRCRRHIPCPSILAERMQRVYELGKQMVLPDGRSLFRDGRDGTESVHSRIMRDVLLGRVSDSPGIEMYVLIRRHDKGELTCMAAQAKCLHCHIVTQSWSYGHAQAGMSTTVPVVLLL